MILITIGGIVQIEIVVIRVNKSGVLNHEQKGIN